MTGLARYWIRGILALSLIVLTPQAYAHSAPEKPRTFYGGQAMATEFYNVELLIANKSVQLFVRDRHNWPVDVRGFSATALLSKPEGSEEIDLVPGKRKALIGSTDVAGIEEVVITLNAPGRESIKLRFNRGSLEATPK